MHEVKKKRYNSNDCSYIRSLFWVITWKLLFSGRGVNLWWRRGEQIFANCRISSLPMPQSWAKPGGVLFCIFRAEIVIICCELKLFLKFVTSPVTAENILDKLTKLSKICFSRECFTADFSQFFKCPSFSFTWLAGYLPSIQSISGLFLKYPDFLRSLKSLGNSWGNL